MMQRRRLLALALVPAAALAAWVYVDRASRLDAGLKRTEAPERDRSEVLAAGLDAVLAVEHDAAGDGQADEGEAAEATRAREAWIARETARTNRERILETCPGDLRFLEEQLAMNEMGLDDPAGILPWEHIQPQAASEFETSDEELARWIRRFTRELPADGVVTREYMDSVLGEDGASASDLSDSAIASLQRVVDRFRPRMLERAGELARGMAEARRTIRENGWYRVSPRFIAPDDPSGSGRVLLTSGGGVNGWCVSYRITGARFPRLERLADSCSDLQGQYLFALRTVLNAELARVR